MEGYIFNCFVIRAARVTPEDNELPRIPDFKNSEVTVSPELNYPSDAALKAYQKLTEEGREWTPGDVIFVVAARDGRVCRYPVRFETHTRKVPVGI